MSLIRFMPPRGTAAQCNAYTGTLGELFVDTDNWQVRLSDGSSAGGHILGGVNNLAGLVDAAISSPTTGQYLRYNATTSKWENHALAWADLTGTPSLVLQSTTVTGSGGLTGGGALSSNQAISVATNGITNAMLAQAPTLTLKGNNAGVTGNVADLTAAQAKTLLAIAAGDVSGLAASATTDTTNASNISSGTLGAGRLPAFTGDVTSPAGSSVNTIAAGAVTYAKLQNVAANSFLGNNSGSAASAVELSPSLAKTLLAIGTADVAGLLSYLNTNQAGSGRLLALNDAGTWNIPGFTSSGSRSSIGNPNAYTYGIAWEFKDSTAISGTGNFRGLMTLAPYTSQTASGGDSSYQLAFMAAAANSTSAPTVQVRAGIDTTWGSWSTLLHSSNYSSYALPLSGGTVTGTVNISTGTNNALTLTNSSGGPYALYLTRSDISSTIGIYNAGGIFGFSAGLSFPSASISGALTFSSQSQVLSGPNSTGIYLNYSGDGYTYHDAQNGYHFRTSGAAVQLTLNSSGAFNGAGGAMVSYASSSYASGKITVQSGGTASGGASGDIFFIY